MAIECKAFKSVASGALIGIATFYVDTWKINIRDVKVFMKNGHRWVKFPDQQYEKEGEKKYMPYLWFDEKHLSEAFSTAAVKAIDDFCAKQSPSVFEPEEPPPFQEPDDIPF
jgi:hypothetical protein